MDNEKQANCQSCGTNNMKIINNILLVLFVISIACVGFVIYNDTNSFTLSFYMVFVIYYVAISFYMINERLNTQHETIIMTSKNLIEVMDRLNSMDKKMI